MKVFSRFRKSTSTTAKTTQKETTSPKSKPTIFSSSSTSPKTPQQVDKNKPVTRTLSSIATTTTTTDAEKKSSASNQQTQATLSTFLQRRQKSAGNRPSSSSLSSSSSSHAKRTSSPKRTSIDNATKRTSTDTEQRRKRASNDAKQRPKSTSISRKREPIPPSVEMIKRRVVLPVSIFDKPMLTEVEFMVDARYRQIKVIGSGSFGVVASALDTRTGSKVAIKKVIGAFGSARSCRYALREVRLLRHMNHGNIVRLTDLDVPNDYKAWQDLYIMTPLLHCDLRQVIVEGRLSGDLRLQKKIAWSIINGLRYMHGQGLMHRDIKTKNVLLNEDLSAVQLCDLGHSRFHSSSAVDVDEDEENNHDDIHETGQEPELTGAVGTMIQSAPEICLGCEYNVGVDIWSAACVISELVHSAPGETLFDNTSKGRHITEIFQVIGYPSESQIATLPDYVAWYLKVKCKRAQKYAGVNNIARKLGLDEHDDVVDLLTSMLAFAAADRPSAAEVLEHRWFDDVRDELSEKDTKFEKSGKYDFAYCEPPKKSSKADMKQLVWEEVIGLHPEAAPLR